LEKDRIVHNLKKYQDQINKIKSTSDLFNKNFDYEKGMDLKKYSLCWNKLKNQIYVLTGMQNVFSDMSKRQMLMDVSVLYDFMKDGHVKFEDNKVMILPPMEMEEYKPWRGGYFYNVYSIRD
jgi:hypothetical protein